MTDEETKNDETATKAAEEGAADAPAEEAPPEDAPAEEPAAEEPVAEEEAPAEEPAAAEEPPAEEAPADEEAPPDEAPEGEPAKAAEPEGQLTPKQKRRRQRSTAGGEALPPRGADERAAERAQRRASRAAARRAYRAGQRRKNAEVQAGNGTPPADRTGGTPKVRQGIVVSDKADKTITVRIDVTRRHRTYTKIVRGSSTLHAHDERNDAHAGDIVRVVESRPLSRKKRWRLVEVLERAK
jgi:small subunit ribosomal protein S17